MEQEVGVCLLNGAGHIPKDLSNLDISPSFIRRGLC